MELKLHVQMKVRQSYVYHYFTDGVCCIQLGVAEDVDMKVRQVREQVKLEAKLQNTLLRLQGSLEPILSVALAAGGHSEE